MAQGQIQVARKSKSGKNLSVQVNGDWYVSKNWEFENMVGQEITFEPATQNFSDGGSITWINEYGATGVATTPAGQSFDQAHAQHQATQNYQPPQQGMTGAASPMRGPAPPQTASVDRDTNITALALVKCVQGLNTPTAAYAAYCELYRMVQQNPNPGAVTQGNAVPEGHVEGYDQEIPF